MNYAVSMHVSDSFRRILQPANLSTYGNLVGGYLLKYRPQRLSTFEDDIAIACRTQVSHYVRVCPETVQCSTLHFDLVLLITVVSFQNSLGVDTINESRFAGSKELELI